MALNSSSLAIPEPSAELSLDTIERTRDQLVEWSKDASLEQAIEYLDGSLALEQYLKKRENQRNLAGPMQTASRHLERRIGELLPPEGEGQGERTDLHSTSYAQVRSLPTVRRQEFRLIAQWWDQIEPLLPKSRAHALRIAEWWTRQRLSDSEAAISPTAGIVSKGRAEDWLRLLPLLSFDLLLTDPPYSTDVDCIEDFVQWVPTALTRLRPTGRAYICTGAYPRELRAYLDVLADQEPAWHCVDVLVWTYRNTLGPSGANYSPNWQAILHVEGPEAPPLQFSSLVERFSVIDMPAPDGRTQGRLHAWQKPDDLADRLLNTAGPVERVLDPFAGTGTFLAAASRRGLLAEGCERDASMLELCRRRGLEVRIREDMNV